MNEDIEIRQSTISGRGVFASRRFKQGERVLKWDLSRKIRRDRIELLPSDEHRFLNPFDDTFLVLLGEPERYVNHSCANNTRVEQFTDVAVRDILPGEEITSDYRSGGAVVDFVCRCGAPNCCSAAFPRGGSSMSSDATPNVKQAVPFLMVTDMEASLRFYVDGLGFTLTNEWRPEKAGGRVQWCWLQLGAAALMLQEYRQDERAGGVPDGPLGNGVSICYMCADAIALYHDFVARGVSARRPFVGNGLWVTSVRDPNGYHLDFESPTDVAEETVFSG